MPHSVPIGTSFASSLNLFKESSSPSNMTILSRSTLTGLFLLIVPSVTIEPAICPNLGDLNISLTSAVPNISSFTSGAKWPSTEVLIPSIRS